MSSTAIVVFFDQDPGNPSNIAALPEQRYDSLPSGIRKTNEVINVEGACVYEEGSNVAFIPATYQSEAVVTEVMIPYLKERNILAVVYYKDCQLL